MMESDHGKRGYLKVYLGYAAGVGKTYQMLTDAHEMKRKGVDVVIGYLETHERKDIVIQAEGLELIPRRKVAYRNSVFEEMDLDAVLRRKPAVCLVDELPHTDVPGSGHTKRWEDALDVLNAGIDVLTTMNIQHLESLNDQIWHMTGVRVRETVPDWVVKQADEVVMVDLTPRALLNRLERGVVYPPAIARRALQNFFKESILVALREIALRQTAYEVESRHATPLDSTWGETAPAESAAGIEEASVPTNERVLVHMTEHPSTAMLIRRGKRVADYLRGECFAVYVQRAADFSSLPAAQREAIEKHLNFARNLHIETRVLEGPDVADALIDFARLYHVTQIFITRPQYSAWQGFPGRNLVHRIVRKARDMQVTVVAERRREKPK